MRGHSLLHDNSDALVCISDPKESSLAGDTMPPGLSENTKYFWTPIAATKTIADFSARVLDAAIPRDSAATKASRVSSGDLVQPGQAENFAARRA
jgi:hypothetical protein